jgi:hypothetical protein
MILINLFLSVEVLVNQLRYRHRLGAITLTKVYTAFGEEARRRRSAAPSATSGARVMRKSR